MSVYPDVVRWQAPGRHQSAVIAVPVRYRSDRMLFVWVRAMTPVGLATQVLSNGLLCDSSSPKLSTNATISTQVIPTRPTADGSSCECSTGDNEIALVFNQRTRLCECLLGQYRSASSGQCEVCPADGTGSELPTVQQGQCRRNETSLTYRNTSFTSGCGNGTYRGIPRLTGRRMHAMPHGHVQTRLR